MTVEEMIEAIRLLDRWGVPPELVGHDPGPNVLVIRLSDIRQALGEPL